MAMLSRLDTKNILFIHNVLLDQILYIYKIHFHTAHTISIDDSIKIPTRTGKYPSLCVEHSRFLYQCLSLFHLLYIYIYIYIYDGASAIRGSLIYQSCNVYTACVAESTLLLLVLLQITQGYHMGEERCQ